MDSKTHIYLVDEKSRRWLIANECVDERYAKKGYKGRFIISNWYETDKYVNIDLKFFDGMSGHLTIESSKILRITRKIKIDAIQSDKFDNDFYSLKERIQINDLRFERLTNICCNKNLRDSFLNWSEKENVKSFLNWTEKGWFGRKRKINIKLSKTEKRKKLAKENRSNGKAKNR